MYHHIYDLLNHQLLAFVMVSPQYLGSNVHEVRDTQWKRLIHSLKLIVLIVGLMKDKATKASLGITGFEYNQTQVQSFR